MGQGEQIQAGTDPVCTAGPPAVYGPDPELFPCSVFVAVDGTDTPTCGHEAHPCATLEAARSRVRENLAKSPLGQTVCLRGGTYELDRTFVLDPARDSGLPGLPITYTSYPGEHAVLSGGVKLAPHWHFYKTVHDTNGQPVAIYSTPMHRHFHSLFVNGRRATRARWPDQGATANLTMAAAASGTMPNGCPICTECQRSFIYSSFIDPTASDWTDPSNVEIVSLARFNSARQRVSSIDPLAKKVTVAGSLQPGDNPGFCNFYGWDYNNNDRFYVENVLHALDSKGEWYLDELKNTLYYAPLDGEDLATSELIAPRLYQLVRSGAYPESSTAIDLTDACRHLTVEPPFGHSLAFGDTSFTVALWLDLPPGTSSPFWLFTKGDPRDNGVIDPTRANKGYGLSMDSTADPVPVSFVLNDGTRPVSITTSQPRGQWTHLAFVVERTSTTSATLTAYVNGVPSSNSTVSLGSIASRIPLDLGAYTNVGCANAKVSGFRIYPTALDASEVGALYNGNAPAGAALSLPLTHDFDDHSTIANRVLVYHAPALVDDGTRRGADFGQNHATDLSGELVGVSFVGLDFRYTDWTMPFTGYPGTSGALLWASPSAVYLHGSYIDIAGNRFSHLGSHALGGMLATSTVINNEFSDIGASAIRLGSVAADTGVLTSLNDFASLNQVTLNRSRNSGVVVLDSDAMAIFSGMYNSILQNTVSRAPFVGIGVGTQQTVVAAGGNRLVLNQVHDVMQMLNDGSGIYAVGWQPGTVIERNIVHDIVETSNHLVSTFIFGLYLDGTAECINASSNLVYRSQSASILLNLGHVRNSATNNIFVDGIDNQVWLNNATPRGAMLGDSFERNIVYYHRTASTILFPTQPIPGQPPLDPIETSDYNLFFSPTYPALQTQLQSWQATTPFDHDSIWADPQFAAYGADDFTVPSSSPAVGLGFVPIDFNAPP